MMASANCDRDRARTKRHRRRYLFEHADDAEPPGGGQTGSGGPMTWMP